MYSSPSIVRIVQHIESGAAAIVQPRKLRTQIKQGKLDKVGTSQHSPTINNTAGPSQSKQRKLNKVSSIARECGICKENFNTQDKLPRLLPCFDCLCSDCIDQLIETKQFACPFCRNSFVASSAQDFHTNKCLVDLIEYVSEQESKRKTAIPFEDWRDDFRTEFTTENLATFQRHKSYIQDAIGRNKKFILDLSQINQDLETIPLTVREIIGKNENWLKKLKGKTVILENMLDVISNKGVQIKEIDNGIKVATSFESVGSIIDKSEVIELDLIKNGQKIADFIEEDEITHKTSLKEIKDTAQKLVTIDNILQAIRNEDFDDTFLTAGDLQSMSNCVRRIIRKGHLYAIKEEQGRKCYAPMRLTSQNKLLLYNLGENYKLPKEAYFIKLNDVLSILDGSIKSVFMEVNTQNREESRFTVCLINKGQYAENFFHLCLGDFGPSYAGSKLLATLYKGTNLEQIRSGDYSSSDGRGGKAVVVGVNWCREKTKLMYKGHNVVTGLVAGVSNSEATVSQFSIYTGNDPTTTVRYPFGMVGEGMNVLTKAISECAEGIQLKIKNCGCIIPIADGTDCD
ncbi:uncharacterized protein LOC135200137 [Macrobrachium nipponense]|uniref:uncharacterized protein LOC135200137 n=1 Tax=Macrobrachium nipponense TaxID=159736 RepID=UPI0030C7F938